MYSYQEYHRHKDWLKLNTASKKNQLKAVKRWLDAGIDPNTYKAEALMHAIEYGHTEVVRLFLDTGKLTIDNKYEALHNSVMNYTRDITDLFLAEPDIDLGPDSKGKRILEYAAIFNRDVDLTQTLLARDDIDPNIDNGVLIVKIINLDRWSYQQTNPIELLKLFLAHDKIRVNSYSYNPIETVCRQGNMEMFNLLYNDARVDPSVQNNKAIQAAAQYGNTEIVKILMADERVDPADNINRAFKLALQYNKFEAAVTLLDDKRVLSLVANDHYKYDKNIQTALFVFFDVKTLDELQPIMQMVK